MGQTSAAEVATSESQHQQEQEALTQWSPARRCVNRVLSTSCCDVLVGLAIVGNCVLAVVDTDYRADHGGEAHSGIQALCGALLTLFTVELGARLYVERCRFFGRALNILDFSVVFADWLLMFESLKDDRTVPRISVLRIFRALSLLKFTRRLRELYLMMHGFVSAAKAMLWVVLLLGLLLSVWGIIAVEFLHEKNVAVADMGLYGDDCDRCRRAYSTVVNSILTFGQQVITGDNWGQLSVPIMESYPETAWVFVGVFLTIDVGALSLILTVIVDRAAEARSEDVALVMRRRQAELATAKTNLLNICAKMDTDVSGVLTGREIMDGYEALPEFASVLDLMDVQREDLAALLQVLDRDGSGDVSYDEFVEQLYKMKCQDQQHTLVFIRSHLKQVQDKLVDEMRMLKDSVVQMADLYQASEVPDEDPLCAMSPGHIDQFAVTLSYDEFGNAYPPQEPLEVARRLRRIEEHEVADSIETIPEPYVRRLADRAGKFDVEAEHCKDEDATQWLAAMAEARWRNTSEDTAAAAEETTNKARRFPIPTPLAVRQPAMCEPMFKARATTPSDPPPEKKSTETTPVTAAPPPPPAVSEPAPPPKDVAPLGASTAAAQATSAGSLFVEAKRPDDAGMPLISDASQLLARLDATGLVGQELSRLRRHLSEDLALVAKMVMRDIDSSLEKLLCVQPDDVESGVGEFREAAISSNFNPMPSLEALDRLGQQSAPSYWPPSRPASDGGSSASRSFSGSRPSPRAGMASGRPPSRSASLHRQGREHHVPPPLGPPRRGSRSRSRGNGDGLRGGERQRGHGGLAEWRSGPAGHAPGAFSSAGGICAERGSNALDFSDVRGGGGSNAIMVAPSSQGITSLALQNYGRTVPDAFSGLRGSQEQGGMPGGSSRNLMVLSGNSYR